MRKRTGCSAALALLLALTASTPSAAAPTRGAIRLGAGISIATGDFGLEWGTGAPIAAALEAEITPRLQIGADVAYQKVDESIGGSIINLIFGNQPELTMWRVGARGEYALRDPGSRWIPRLVGGVALHPSKIEVRRSNGTRQEFKDTGIGVSAGLGLDYRLGRGWALGLESVYYWVKSDTDKIQYSTMPYLDFSLGLRWQWGSGE